MLTCNVLQRLDIKSKSKTACKSSATLAGVANAELSANIGLASDYLWRGVTQNDRDIAYSGGLDYAHESGFFVGAWASKTEFSGEDGYELDWYLGYANDIGEVSYSAMVNRYSYPDYEDSDFTELMLDVSYKQFSAGITYTFDSDVSEPGIFVEDDIYYYGAVEFALAEGISLVATAGYYDFADDQKSGVGDVSYAHYQLDLTKTLNDFGDLTASFSKADEESGDNNLLFTVSWVKSFDL